ncbi:MAG: nucleotide exchange factor GrpE [Aristaeellaceae bacterium]
MNENEMPVDQTVPQPTEADIPAAEPEAPQAEGGDNAVDADALRQELESATAKAEEYLTLAQRVQADFDNFRRRNESVRSDAFADGQRNVITAMLPVLDNLERALEAAGESDDALRTGVEMTLRQLRDALTKLGVTPIDRLGEKFDPKVENAILQGSPEEGEPGTVCAVLQKGYMVGSFVLRHAMVKVVPE